MSRERKKAAKAARRLPWHTIHAEGLVQVEHWPELWTWTIRTPRDDPGVELIWRDNDDTSIERVYQTEAEAREAVDLVLTGPVTVADIREAMGLE